MWPLLPREPPGRSEEATAQALRALLNAQKGQGWEPVGFRLWANVRFSQATPSACCP